MINVGSAHSSQQSALVTGAARGLGRGISRRLVQDGWRIFMIDVNPDVNTTAEELAREMDVSKETLVPWVADVASEEQMVRAVAEAVSRFGGLDLAVANAGTGGVEIDLLDLDAEEFDRIIAINLRGTYLTAREAGRVMRQAKQGSIVTISSIFGLEPYPRTAAYSASKAGVIAMTQALAAEMAPYKVRVNSIAPGYFATEMQWEGLRARAAHAGITFEEEKQRVWDLVPLGRHGTPEEIGAAVAFLASPDAAYITGTTLPIHGGVVRR